MGRLERRRSTLKTRTTIAALAVTAALGAPAVAPAMIPDLRGDTQGPAVTQDLRSPDARTGYVAVSAQDFRSPDARVAYHSGSASLPNAAAPSNTTFPATVAIVLAMSLALALGLVVQTMRRRRRAGGLAPTV
jgi:hypothetical protein